MRFKHGLWMEPEFWLQPEQGVLVGYVADYRGKPVPMALLLYRPITSKSMRSLDLVRYRYPDPEWERFDGPQPPTPTSVMTHETYPYAEMEKISELASKMLQRMDRDTPDDFYGRVAKVYLMFKGYGAPIRDIADLAGVPHSTAARWVRQCRIRPKDSQQKFL